MHKGALYQYIQFVPKSQPLFCYTPTLYSKTMQSEMNYLL